MMWEQKVKVHLLVSKKISFKKKYINTNNPSSMSCKVHFKVKEICLRISYSNMLVFFVCFCSLKARKVPQTELSSGDELVHVYSDLRM